MTPRQLIGSLASAVAICLIAAAPATVRARADQAPTATPAAVSTGQPSNPTGGECSAVRGPAASQV